jgi:hypothetical protein
MTDTYFEREVLSRLRAISNNCIDPWAVGRLRILADEVEQNAPAFDGDNFKDRGQPPNDHR